jgi:hypothetical protein
VDLERVPLSLVSTIEELLGRNSSGSGLEILEYGRGDPLRWPRDTLYPKKLALTSPRSGGRSVGIVRSRTMTMEFCFFIPVAGRGGLCGSEMFRIVHCLDGGIVDLTRRPRSTLQKYFLVLISVRGWVDPRVSSLNWGYRIPEASSIISWAPSSSYIATDGQSGSSSWCRDPFAAHDHILIFFEWQLLPFFFM